MEVAVMRQFSKKQIVRAAAVVVLWATAVPAWAGYLVNGYDFGLVGVGQRPGKHRSQRANQTPMVVIGGGQNVATTFTVPQCQTVDFSRLYLDVYGGTPYHTAQMTATLNGVALPTLNIGGSGNLDDWNPATATPIRPASMVQVSATGRSPMPAWHRC